jgi:hypothetical protein
LGLARGAASVVTLAAALALTAVAPFGADAQLDSGVPKQVHLVEDGNRLIASNVRFSRFDELKLDGRERVQKTAVGEAVIVVVTNQRLIAYGVVSGWRPIDRLAGEQIDTVSAQDYGGLIVTSQRLLNFNGQSGVWGERDRRASR